MWSQIFLRWQTVKVTFLTATADYSWVLQNFYCRALVKLFTLTDRANKEPHYEFEACVKYSLTLSKNMHALTKLHRDQGSCAECHGAHSGEVRGWIRHCKSGTNYTPVASISLREFRIGSCEKPSATQATKPKLFQEDLVVRPPQVEQMCELDNQRSLF